MPKIHKGQKGRKDLVMMEPEALGIIEDEKDPRFDPRSKKPIDEGMVQSIMHFGVIQPLSIYADGDRVLVAVGHQRRINAIEANKRLKKAGRPTILVPCTWRKDSDIGLFAVRQAENNVRTGDSALERAKNMQHLIDMGGSEKDVALAFGCNPATVKNTLALLDCDAKVQRAVESGQVAATVAMKLAKLPREEQKKRLDKMLESGAVKGARGKRAAEKGETEPVAKMLSRKKIEALRDGFKQMHLASSEWYAALLDFVLGNTGALDEFSSLKSVAMDVFLAKNGHAKVEARS